jgi:hypothetical protein
MSVVYGSLLTEVGSGISETIGPQPSWLHPHFEILTILYQEYPSILTKLNSHPIFHILNLIFAKFSQNTHKLG